MREPLLFLCLAHLRAGSWQRLRGYLVLLLLATVWVPYQVQVPRERCLGLAPLLRVASDLGSATSGVIAIHQKSICQVGTGSPVLGPVCGTICPVRALYSPEGRHTYVGECVRSAA